MFFNKKSLSNARLEKVSTEKQIRDARIIREVSWVALSALGAFFAVVLFSYHREDPGWTHAVDDAVQIQNAGGVAGAWISDIFLSLFGFSAWIS